MFKGDVIQMYGEVMKNLPMQLSGSNWKKVISYLGIMSGKMRMRYIRILSGDKVTVELTPYDLSRARIVFRAK